MSNQPGVTNGPNTPPQQPPKDGNGFLSAAAAAGGVLAGAVRGFSLFNHIKSGFAGVGFGAATILVATGIVGAGIPGLIVGTGVLALGVGAGYGISKLKGRMSGGALGNRFKPATAMATGTAMVALAAVGPSISPAQKPFGQEFKDVNKAFSDNAAQQAKSDENETFVFNGRSVTYDKKTGEIIVAEDISVKDQRRRMNRSIEEAHETARARREGREPAKAPKAPAPGGGSV